MHKVGYCVKCHYKVFSSEAAAKITDPERDAFVKKCLPEALPGNIAFSNMQEKFQCTGDDKKYAEASISGF